ncbi:MAG: hypothetical protein BWY45_03279 [Euryarchaeota archaeon ADurb.Bin294]|nr:MAG: hypothetical protein BWY45_03279 [Euryarchaeota archaeon ADurb.Bin294]
MDSSNPCAGKHGYNKLRDAWHVDTDPIPFLHAKRFQGIAKPHDILVKLVIGKNPFFTIFPCPEDGDFVSPVIIDMPLQAVVGNIQVCAGEPVSIGMVPYLYIIPLFEPEKI